MFDGVGRWASISGDPGLYSKQLARLTALRLRNDYGSSDANALIQALAHATEENSAVGSATAYVIAITGDTLNVLYLGDSGLIVVRNGRTSTQFNAYGRHSIAEDAEVDFEEPRRMSLSHAPKRSPFRRDSNLRQSIVLPGAAPRSAGAFIMGGRASIGDRGSGRHKRSIDYDFHIAFCRFQADFERIHQDLVAFQQAQLNADGYPGDVGANHEEEVYREMQRRLWVAVLSHIRALPNSSFLEVSALVSREQDDQRALDANKVNQDIDFFSKLDHPRKLRSYHPIFLDPYFDKCSLAMLKLTNMHLSEKIIVDPGSLVMLLQDAIRPLEDKLLPVASFSQLQAGATGNMEYIRSTVNSGTVNESGKGGVVATEGTCHHWCFPAFCAFCGPSLAISINNHASGGLPVREIYGLHTQFIFCDVAPETTMFTKPVAGVKEATKHSRPIGEEVTRVLAREMVLESVADQSTFDLSQIHEVFLKD